MVATWLPGMPDWEKAPSYQPELAIVDFLQDTIVRTAVVNVNAVVFRSGEKLPGFQPESESCAISIRLF
jgi:hypothetical protein